MLGFGGSQLVYGTLADRFGRKPVLLTGLSSQPEVNLLPGGVPVMVDGQLVGAIGVAGGNNGEDHPIAEAGLAGLTAATIAG